LKKRVKERARLCAYFIYSNEHTHTHTHAQTHTHTHTHTHIPKLPRRTPVGALTERDRGRKRERERERERGRDRKIVFMWVNVCARASCVCVYTYTHIPNCHVAPRWGLRVPRAHLYNYKITCLLCRAMLPMCVRRERKQQITHQY